VGENSLLNWVLYFLENFRKDALREKGWGLWCDEWLFFAVRFLSEPKSLLRFPFILFPFPRRCPPFMNHEKDTFFPRQDVSARDFSQNEGQDPLPASFLQPGLPRGRARAAPNPVSNRWTLPFRVMKSSSDVLQDLLKAPPFFSPHFSR